MRFPDHADLGIVTVEGAGDFRISMDRVGAARPDALWTDPHPTTDEGRRLLDAFIQRGPQDWNVRDLGQRICQIENEAAGVTLDPSPAPMEPLDGVDCDWDDNGKCRCRPATDTALLARLDVEAGLIESYNLASARYEALQEAARRVVDVDARYARSFVPPQLSEAVDALRAALDGVTLAATPAPLDTSHAALVAAAETFLRRTGGLTVHFNGGRGYLSVHTDWIDDLDVALRAALDGGEV